MATPIDQTLHTGTINNVPSSQPLGNFTFDVAGNDTFTEVGSEKFVQTITNLTKH